MDGCNQSDADSLVKVQLHVNAAKIMTVLPISSSLPYFNFKTGWETLAERRKSKNLKSWITQSITNRHLAYQAYFLIELTKYLIITQRLNSSINMTNVILRYNCKILSKVSSLYVIVIGQL